MGLWVLGPMLALAGTALTPDGQAGQGQDVPEAGLNFYQGVPEPKPHTPDPCEGVDQATLRAAFEAALAHVRATGANEQKFRSHITNCAKRDFRYYMAVIAS